MNPHNTFAVIVGIEKYRLDSSDLSGPGGDAVSFVEWLRTNGVPATNIFLFLSPLDGNRPELTSRLESPEVGVSQNTAGRSAIEECLLALGNPERFGGELLYLFWGGHGIADEQGNRYLFYSDTTDETLNYHLDLPTWLGQLASYGHFAHQIGYFDTCANLKSHWKLGANKLPSKPRNASQSIFFAAAIGQRAANNELTRSGKFSQTLRRVFAEIQDVDPTWPPSPRLVIETLSAKFKNDRTQMPVFYEAGDFSGNRWSGGEVPASEFVESVARDFGYAVRDLRSWASDASHYPKLMSHQARDKILRILERDAGRQDGDLGPILSDGVEDWVRTFAIAIRLGLLTRVQELIDEFELYARPLSQNMQTATDLTELDRRLERTGLSWEELQKTYARTIEHRASHQPTPDNRRDLLRALPLSADDRLRYVAELVTRANMLAKDDSLEEWVVRHVRPSTLEEIRVKLQREAANEIYYLLYWVKPGQLTPVLFRGKAFEFVKKWPARQFRNEELATLVDEYLAEAELCSQNLFVQFLVSLEYFAWSPHAVLVRSELGGSAPLGSTYPTVMRWRERALGLPRTRHKEWTERANRILKRAELLPCLSCCWIGEDLDGQPLTILLNEVGSEYIVVAFDFPAPRILKGGRGPLTQAILDGVPVILWPCEDPPDRSAIRKTFSGHAAQTSLKHLNRTLKNCYADQYMRWKMTLFWDDPKDKPEKWEYADDF